MTVYLIHLTAPISHARHYLGYTEAESVDARLARHRSGTGARLLRVANERGIEYNVVRTWEGDKRLERRLKKRKNSPRLCPVCNPESWRREGKYYE